MIRLFLTGVITLLATAGTWGWLNRDLVFTHFALKRIKANEYYVAPYRPVEWRSGPEEADAVVGDRPPNIIFILFDDLFHPSI